SFIEKYVDLFNGLNLSSHIFDLAYLGFGWEDLLENQLDLMILSKLNHVDLSLKEISISMQALEYLGAYKHPSVTLDEVLHHLLVKIEKEFDLFYQDKHLSNALYVLY